MVADPVSQEEVILSFLPTEKEFNLYRLGTT